MKRYYILGTLCTLLLLTSLNACKQTQTQTASTPQLPTPVDSTATPTIQLADLSRGDANPDIYDQYEDVTYADLTFGEIKPGEKWRIPCGTYLFSIDEHRGLSEVHVYNTITDDEIDTAVLMYPNVSDVIMNIPENSYVRASHVHFSEINY